MNNKWWEKYSGEPNVLIEDVGQTHLWMGDFLKIWADRYGFRAEIKCDSRVLRPLKIVVTSNYTIRELWPDKAVYVCSKVPYYLLISQEPLERRFKLIEHAPMVEAQPIVNIDHILGAKRLDGKWCIQHGRRPCGHEGEFLCEDEDSEDSSLEPCVLDKIEEIRKINDSMDQ